MRETMTSTLILGSRVVSTGTPRYFSGVPFWMPQPMTCVTVMPVTPRSFRAVFNWSNLASFEMMDTLCIPVS